MNVMMFHAVSSWLALDPVMIELKYLVSLLSTVNDAGGGGSEGPGSGAIVVVVEVVEVVVLVVVVVVLIGEANVTSG